MSTRQSRREFLENSMFAAAAAVVGSAAVPSFQREVRAVGANERIGMAVIGTRGRGGEHISEWTRHYPESEITAVCDIDDGVLGKSVERIEKAQGTKPTGYRDIRKLMEDKTVDAVSIATPNHWHSLAAIWAIQAGKDVYCEKPVSHNVSEGRRVVEAARKYQKICQTGTQCRSMKGTLDAIEFVKAGKIGEVKLARGLCYKRRPSIGPKGNYEVPAGIDYDLWLGPAPVKPLTRKQFHYDWHWQWDYGNGDLGNQGIHQMDIARWGLGVDSLGVGVLSYGGRLSYEDAGETANTQVCIHDYGDKTLVFEVRGLVTKDYKGANVGVIFHGTDGYVVLSSYTGGAAFDKDGNMTTKFSGGGDHFGNFLKAVKSRKPEDLAADIQEGHLSSALCHLGNISYRLGKQTSAAAAKEALAASKIKNETLDTFERFTEHLAANDVSLDKTQLQFGANLSLVPGGEKFTGAGSEQANAMLTRDYRAPFIVPATKDL
jgi:predicted dehydrogenase